MAFLNDQEGSVLNHDVETSLLFNLLNKNLNDFYSSILDRSDTNFLHDDNKYFRYSEWEHDEAEPGLGERNWSHWLIPSARTHYLESSKNVILNVTKKVMSLNKSTMNGDEQFVFDKSNTFKFLTNLELIIY